MSDESSLMDQEKPQRIVDKITEFFKKFLKRKSDDSQLNNSQIEG